MLLKWQGVRITIGKASSKLFFVLIICLTFIDGFVLAKSTFSELLMTIQDWTTYLNSGDDFHCVCIDQKAVFDKVSHATLVKKLRDLGVCSQRPGSRLIIHAEFSR